MSRAIPKMGDRAGLVRSWLRLGLFIVACASPAGLARAGEKVVLRYQLKKGQTYALKVTTKEKIRAQGVQDEGAGLGLEFNVTDVDADGNMTATVRFAWVFASEQGMGGNEEYDSDDPPEELDAMVSGYAGLIGRTFDVKFTPTGRVLEVSRSAGVLKGVMKSLQNGLLKNALAAQFKKRFGPDGLRELVAGMLERFPDKAVGVGESWNRKRTESSGIARERTDTWTLKSLKGDRAEIALQSKSKTLPDHPLDNGMMKISFDLQSEESGSIVIDLRNGWIQSGNMHESSEGTVSPMMQGAAAASRPITIDKDVKIEPFAPKPKPAATQPDKSK